MPNLRSTKGQAAAETDCENLATDNAIVNDTNLLNRIDEVVQKAVEKAMERERAKMNEELEKREQKLTALIEQKLGTLHDLEVSIDEKIEQLKESQQTIENNKVKVAELTRDLDDLQQYSRRNNIRVFGIPEKPDEETDALVCSIAERIGVGITTQDIDRSHRVGRREPQPSQPRPPSYASAARSNQSTQNPPRPIIVKFISHKAKLAFIRNRRKLKGSKVVVAEDLTKKKATLLSQTSRNEKVSTAWTTDGRIFAMIKTTNGREMRKLITSEETLSNL